MSGENLEVVRRIYDDWNAGDLGLQSFDPAFELRQTGMLLDSATVFRGHDGLLQAVRELFSGLRDLRWEPEDFIAAPEDRVVVPFRFLASGRSSGASVDMSLIHVWTLRDNLAIRCVTYEDLGEAVEAAGLRE